jgi:uncharacterized protein YndB with AHSA1/START domain
MGRRTLGADAATVHVAAPPERVYELVADITRMGEWSPECYHCEWIGDATAPEVGARFKARNKRGLLRWSNTPTIVAADVAREFAFVRSMPGAGEYRWSYKMTPDNEGGTQLTESYEAVRPERWLNSAFANLFTPSRDEQSHLRRGMEATLARIKDAAEREHGRPVA